MKDQWIPLAYGESPPDYLNDFQRVKGMFQQVDGVERIRHKQLLITPQTKPKGFDYGSD